MARWVTISTTVNSVFKSLRIILFVQHHRKGLEIPQLIIHLSVAYIRCLQNTRASLRRESLPEELLQHQRTTADRKVNRYAESVPLGFFCLPPCFVLVAKLNAMLATSLSRSRSFGGPEEDVKEGRTDKSISRRRQRVAPGMIAREGLGNDIGVLCLP